MQNTKMVIVRVFHTHTFAGKMMAKLMLQSATQHGKTETALFLTNLVAEKELVSNAQRSSLEALVLEQSKEIANLRQQLRQMENIFQALNSSFATVQSNQEKLTKIFKKATE